MNYSGLVWNLGIVSEAGFRAQVLGVDDEMKGMPRSKVKYEGLRGGHTRLHKLGFGSILLQLRRSIVF